MHPLSSLSGNQHATEILKRSSNSSLQGRLDVANLPPELRDLMQQASDSKIKDRLAPELERNPAAHDGELKEVFRDFVGQTLFGQMISAMRSTQEEPAYFHGGRAEEIFQGQLDQKLAEEISDASASQIADPMYELFTLPRPQ